MKKNRFVYLQKTWFKFYQNPDPHSSKMLDPDPHITNVDLNHCSKASKVLHQFKKIRNTFIMLMYLFCVGRE
jgi:hypothetical protein